MTGQSVVKGYGYACADGFRSGPIFPTAEAARQYSSVLGPTHAPFLVVRYDEVVTVISDGLLANGEIRDDTVRAS